VINDVCAYICENDLRSRVRGFVWEALTRLALRDDVGAVVINSHSQGTAVALDALDGMEVDVSKKVVVLVTAGSHLRKMVDLFAWGDSINRPDQDLPWLRNWHNFWDRADPVADPLRPGPKWKVGANPDVRATDPTLYVSVDPNGGSPLKVAIQDHCVKNTTWSEGGGLRAHNYWANAEQFVPQLAQLLVQADQPIAVPTGVASAASTTRAYSAKSVFRGGAGGTSMNNGTQRITVQFPGEAFGDHSDDLSPPIVQLLQDLHVLASGTDLAQADGRQAAFKGPPQSVAIIEAGATALGKWWATTLGAGAGLTAIVATVQGIWGNEHDLVRVAFVGGAAVVLAALAVAIGLIVSGDVRGRAAGAVAEYQARAQVASTFMTVA